jgi:hypothetical protein
MKLLKNLFVILLLIGIFSFVPSKTFAAIPVPPKAPTPPPAPLIIPRIFSQYIGYFTNTTVGTVNNPIALTKIVEDLQGNITGQASIPVSFGNTVKYSTGALAGKVYGAKPGTNTAVITFNVASINPQPYGNWIIAYVGKVQFTGSEDFKTTIKSLMFGGWTGVSQQYGTQVGAWSVIQAKGVNLAPIVSEPTPPAEPTAPVAPPVPQPPSNPSSSTIILGE